MSWIFSMENNLIQHRPTSLTLRLTIFIGITTTLALLTFGWIIQRSIEFHFAEQDADELQVVADSVKSVLLRQSFESKDISNLSSQLATAVSGHHEVFYYVADINGRLIYASPGSNLGRIAEATMPVQHIATDTLHVWQDSNMTYRGAVMNISVTDKLDNQHQFVLVVATNIDFHLHYLVDFRRTLWATTLIACAIVILMVWFAVYQGHAPLRQISKKIRSITSEQLHVRLDSQTSPIELAEVTTSFNDLLGRIEDVFLRLSHFSADIAHELRTPITNLTTQTQVALSKARNIEQYREVLYSNLEEYERIAKMIGEMLYLARTENGLLKPENEILDLTQELQSLFDYFEAWSEECGVLLKLAGNASPVYGDRLMLRRAFSNLISNAIRYTPQGQSVTVTLAMMSNSVLVTIENPGAEIPPEHLNRLFDRFYRVDSTHHTVNEAGLGLAIVKSIIEAHGGSIMVSSTNGKTIFQVTLTDIAS